VADRVLRGNPDARPDAPPPRIERLAVNGTTLYCEVRGQGPAVLLIHAGGQDAEVWRPIAERLNGFTVVTYDRRGTLRSGRQDWPGKGSAQHADDAAALLDALGLEQALVFGASSGGIPALQLALRHPQLIRQALVFEPGYFRQVSGGEDLQLPVNAALAEHLAQHPGDWTGAYAVFKRTASPPSGARPGALAAPPGKEWYAAREDLDAEALVRDDAPILTRELVDEDRLASAPTEMRFSYGSHSPSVFHHIATRLASIRGQMPDVLDGVGHLVHYFPDTTAEYIAASFGGAGT
jgi:pimeloyl-ACP methyl ester carboxylesterase